MFISGHNSTRIIKDHADNRIWTEIMEEKQVFAKIKRDYQLSTLPEILAQVIRACEDRDSSIEKIAAIISRDMALTGKVLRISNSSFYGRPTKVTSVKDAISVVGTRTLKSVALSVSVYDLCTRLETQLDIRDFWRHSLEVAVLAELIATKVGYELPDEAFVAGLLYDLGIVILDSAYPKQYGQIWQDIKNNGNLIEHENKTFGTNHARVGAFLASEWKLPPNLVRAIGDHHKEVETGELDRAQRLCQIITLANYTGKFAMYTPVFRGGEDFSNRNRILENLKLSDEDILKIQRESVERLVETANLLDIEVGSPLDLVQKANDMLSQMNAQLETLYQQGGAVVDNVPSAMVDDIATDVMHTVVATFSHYFNNACATILGRSQLLEMSLQRGDIKDSEDATLTHSLMVIQNGVEAITNVLNVMKSVGSFETVQYHERAKIINLQEELEQLTAGKLDPLQATRKVL